MLTPTAAAEKNNLRLIGFSSRWPRTLLNCLLFTWPEVNTGVYPVPSMAYCTSLDLLEVPHSYETQRENRTLMFWHSKHCLKVTNHQQRVTEIIARSSVEISLRLCSHVVLQAVSSGKGCTLRWLLHVSGREIHADACFNLNTEIQVTKKQSGVTCLRVHNFPAADSEETGMNKVPANELKCVSSCFRKSGVFYEIRANN